MDVACDPIGRHALRRIEVKGRLEVHPELGCRPEVASESERRVGGDPPASIDDLTHPGHRYTQISSEAMDADFERLHQILPKDLTRMDGRQTTGLLRHGLLHQW